jgi:hypothetical protein
MKALFIALAVLTAAQLPAQAPVVVPAVPPPQEVHSSELRIGLNMLPVMRTSVLDGAGPTTVKGTLSGFDLFARTQNIGIYARSVTGTFDSGSQGLAGKFLYEEARLVIGAPSLSVEAGAVRRTASTLQDEGDHTFWRGGLRSNWDIGGSGVQVTLDAGGRFGKGADSTMQFLGVDAEATVLLQAPRRLPIYVMAGWRYERFDDGWSLAARTEELSGPVLGLGFRLAKRPFLR